jgi:hypothetical protein
VPGAAKISILSVADRMGWQVQDRARTELNMRGT